MKEQDLEKIVAAYNRLVAADEEPTGESIIPTGRPISREDWETLLPFLRQDVKLSQTVGMYELNTAMRLPVGMLQVDDKCYVTIPKYEYHFIMALIWNSIRDVYERRHFAKAKLYSLED